MGEIIFAIFVIAGFFVIMPVFISLWFWYYIQTPGKKIRRIEKIYQISYKRFKIMYLICPDNWSHYKNRIYYKNCLEDVTQTFYFNFIDYIRFERFLKKKRIEKMDKEQNERMVKVLKCFQVDINNYNKRNIDYLREKVRNISDEKRRF